MADPACPCGSDELVSYVDCCQRLHSGQSMAATAEQLMRSRYCAFVKHQVDYIVQTTATGQQHGLDRSALEQWSAVNQWLRLEVVSVRGKLDKTHASVEFRAHYHDGEQLRVHHEVSYFVRQGATWYFLDPTLALQLTMKQPCLCGSGKKFKQCCAQYLLFPSEIS
ncbi:YchJ family protein [Acinetobacter sp. WZC-1]|uniref:YchJ family protein n=1 Tax=Acinetobacter sp. WZC-1 TaxID=3459034 RepID=UPI00403D9231